MKVKIRKKINTMLIVDYKTGKLKAPQYQDYTQLMYYAIYMFKKYGKLDKIKIMYLYVEHSYDNSMMLERKYLDNYINDIKTNINNIEISVFDKNETKLCNWCDYEDYCKSVDI